MSRCINHKIGDMLHAYELNQLDADSREKFEIHLLDCEYCFNEVTKFEKVAGLMTADKEVRDIIVRELVPEATNIVSRAWQKLADSFWPQTQFAWKPVIAYLVIILMAYPAYLGVRKAGENDIRQVVPLNLVPDRASSVSIDKADSDILLTFVFSGAVPDNIYSVEIKSPDGRTIYANDRFKGFDKYEVGRLILPARKIRKGEYTLTIHGQDESSNYMTQIYTFNIE